VSKVTKIISAQQGESQVMGNRLAGFWKREQGEQFFPIDQAR